MENMEFEPEINPDLFDEEFDDFDDEFEPSADYDDHAWDEEQIKEEEK